jgi:hypothetical protein
MLGGKASHYSVAKYDENSSSPILTKRKLQDGQGTK